MSTFASIGLAKAAPRITSRREIDLSNPIIPPARPRLSRAERTAAQARIAAAEAKRQRRRERNLRIMGAVA
ncbi:hypothetical protein [Aquamicrobium soli]|uniref:Transcriptional regulator n=1 Tax=Aquamicrobium soli TaxID=1811518 RepID=A0ABV7KEE4_9HYPH